MPAEHAHPTGLLARVRHALFHDHDEVSTDSVMETSKEAMRALLVSFLILFLTTLIQAGVFLLSSSTALLGDTLHNLTDALSAIPLAIAFTLGRRECTRRFTYGFGRAEDLAGLVVVLLILASAFFAAWQSITHFASPEPVTHLPWVAAAAVVGGLGNELVARYRIKVGRRIGSAALVADGLHARTDALTSLAVLLATLGTALGWRYADPVVGLLITLAILSTLRGAASEVFSRLMDAIDPSLLDQAEAALASTPGVKEVSAVRMRWIGHSLLAGCTIAVDPDLTVSQAHQIAHDAQDILREAVPRLRWASVHVRPAH